MNQKFAFHLHFHANAKFIRWCCCDVVMMMMIVLSIRHSNTKENGTFRHLFGGKITMYYIWVPAHQQHNTLTKCSLISQIAKKGLKSRKSQYLHLCPGRTTPSTILGIQEGRGGGVTGYQQPTTNWPCYLLLTPNISQI